MDVLGFLSGDSVSEFFLVGTRREQLSWLRLFWGFGSGLGLSPGVAFLEVLLVLFLFGCCCFGSDHF